MRGDFLTLTAVLAVTYSLTIIAFFVTGRYRVPILPILAIGSGVTLVGVFDSIRLRRIRSAAAMIAASVLLATVLSFDYLGIREKTAGFAEISLAADLLDPYPLAVHGHAQGLPVTEKSPDKDPVELQ